MFKPERTASAKVLRQRAPGILEEQEAGQCAWKRMNDGGGKLWELRSERQSRAESNLLKLIYSESHRFWYNLKK